MLGSTTWYQLGELPPLENNVISSRVFGGPEDDRIDSLFQLEDGGFIAAGSTASWGLGGSPDEPFDFWLVRLDENLNILWNHTYGTNRTEGLPALAVCSDGGYALAGYTLVNKSGSSDADVLLVRTDENGNHLWNQTLGGPEGDYPEAITQCDDDGFAIAGNTSSYGAGSYDAWLLKTDSTGTPEWNHTYGGPDADGALDLIETDSGFLLVGDTLSYANTTEYSDAYLVCTDTDGTLLWNRTTSQGLRGFFSQISATRSGDYLILGASGDSAVIYYITANGDILWEILRYPREWYAPFSLMIESFPGREMIGEVIECHDGGFAIVSEIRTGSWFASWGSSDLFLGRIDTEGNWLWDQKYRPYSTGGNDDGGAAILQLIDGSFLLAGFTNTETASGMDAWLLRVTDIDIMPYIMQYSMHHIITQAFLAGIIISLTIIIITTVILAYHIRKRRNTTTQSPQAD